MRTQRPDADADVGVPDQLEGLIPPSSATAATLHAAWPKAGTGAPPQPRRRPDGQSEAALSVAVPERNATCSMSLGFQERTRTFGHRRWRPWRARRKSCRGGGARGRAAAGRATARAGGSRGTRGRRRRAPGTRHPWRGSTRRGPRRRLERERLRRRRAAQRAAGLQEKLEKAEILSYSQVYSCLPPEHQKQKPHHTQHGDRVLLVLAHSFPCLQDRQSSKVETASGVVHLPNSILVCD
jgi:hypothetical protein